MRRGCRLTFSRFEVHSIGYDVLQLHQFQLAGFRAAECGCSGGDAGSGRRAAALGGAGCCGAASAGAARRSPARARPEPLPSTRPCPWSIPAAALLLFFGHAHSCSSARTVCTAAQVDLWWIESECRGAEVAL